MPTLLQFVSMVAVELVKLAFYTVLWLLMVAGTVAVSASIVYIHVLAHRHYGWLGLYWTLCMEVVALAAVIYVLRCALLTPEGARR